MVAIKPHHFIDLVTTYGAGTLDLEPHPYGHAVHTVARQILDNRDVELVMELGADDICVPCSHNIGGVCDDTIDTSFRPAAPSSKREWNLLIDERWCARLGLAPGDRLSAREFCHKLQNSAGDLYDIYREVPRTMTDERRGKLAAGVARFLESTK